MVFHSSGWAEAVGSQQAIVIAKGQIGPAMIARHVRGVTSGASWGRRKTNLM
jgi:hypothetical protein